MAFEQLDLDLIQDVAQAKRAIIGLLNLVEDLQATVRELQAEVQRLRDENNHLKGEQGQPDIKPNRRGKQLGPGIDHSSEAERRKPQVWQKGNKLAKITIDREEVLRVDPAQLPADAEFKGYVDTVVQDVVIQHRQCAVPQREVLLAEHAPDVSGGTAAGLCRAIRAGDQGVGAGAVFRLQRGRAEDPGILRQCWYSIVGG